jgi:putative FmdB family regulatory protein
MPIYEYTCSGCRREFEALVSSGRPTACPSCGATRLVKRLSVFAVGSSSVASREPAAGPCGTCGDPRGPGACGLD